MTRHLASTLIATSLLAGAPALAQDTGGELGGSDLGSGLTAPSFEIQNLPPTVSYEFGVHMSFGTVTFWRDYVDMWIGFGARFAGGRNLAGGHRLGGSLTALAEGPFGVHTSMALEPLAAWDWVPKKGGPQLGLSLGPSIMRHTGATSGATTIVQGTVNPTAAMRFGYSQPWTRIGRRLYVVLEPKVRYLDGRPNVLTALVVGSGAGA